MTAAWRAVAGLLAVFEWRFSAVAIAGDYVEGLRSGKGVMLLPDGGTYTGDFAADKFEGAGTYEYPDGSCFVGAWLAGKKHGPGVLLALH